MELPPTLDPTEIPPVILLRYSGYIFTLFQQTILPSGEKSKQECVIFPNNDELFFKTPLSEFMNSIKVHFDISDVDVILEFPSLSLYLHQDSVYSHSLTLNHLYQLYVASCSAHFISIPNMPPFNIILKKESILFHQEYTDWIRQAKSIQHVENPFKDKGTEEEPIVLLDSESELDSQSDSVSVSEIDSIANDQVIVESIDD